MFKESKNPDNLVRDDRDRPFFGSVKEFILELLKVIVISLVVIIPVRYFLIQPFYVKGASMEPNFYAKDYLIINEISYRFNDPERGDILIFRYPNDLSQVFIKRVIGLPGERIKISKGKIVIINDENPNGFELDEKDYLEESILISGDSNIEIDADEYFVLGDNRNLSLDSRVFGTIHKKYIIGKTWIRGWPFDQFKIFKTLEY